MPNKLRRVFSGFGPSRKGAGLDSASTSKDRYSHPSREESIAQLLSKEPARYVLGDLENGTDGHRESVLPSSVSSDLIRSLVTDSGKLTGSTEHVQNLGEPPADSSRNRVQLVGLLLMENQRLNSLVDLANGEVNRNHSALEETKQQFANFMKERFGFSQRIHRLDEEKKRLQDQLDVVHQNYKTVYELEISQLREELADVRLTLENTVAEHNTTISKLHDSQNETATLKDKLEDNCRTLQDLELNLQTVKSHAEFLSGQKAAFDKLTKEHASLQTERRLCQDKVDKLEAALASQPTLEKLQHDSDALSKEKVICQGRIDTLSQTLLAADRRTRMLYHLTGRKLDVQPDGIDRLNIRRGRNKTSRSPSQEVVKAIEQLNATITDVASALTPHFLTAIPLGENTRRCKMILGDWVTSVLLRGGCDQPWFLRSIVQVFLVDWCRAIIEAWYPKQKPFSELLMSELISRKRGKEPGAVSFQLIQMMSNGKATPDLQPWAEEILNDLLQILPSPAPGLTSYSRNHVISPKLIQVCQISYDIRLALAEDDICGNLQLLIYPPDTPFGRDEMRVPQVADGPSGALNKSAIDHSGDIAGTIGIGLREVKIEKSREGISSLKYRTLLAPSVMLARDIQASLSIDDASPAPPVPNPEALAIPSSPQSMFSSQTIYSIIPTILTCLFLYYYHFLLQQS